MSKKKFDISSYHTIFKNSDGWILKKIDSEHCSSNNSNETIFLSTEELKQHGILRSSQRLHNKTDSEIIPILIPIKKKDNKKNV